MGEEKQFELYSLSKINLMRTQILIMVLLMRPPLNQQVTTENELILFQNSEKHEKSSRLQVQSHKIKTLHIKMNKFRGATPASKLFS